MEAGLAYDLVPFSNREINLAPPVSHMYDFFSFSFKRDDAVTKLETNLYTCPCNQEKGLCTHVCVCGG